MTLIAVILAFNAIVGGAVVFRPSTVRVSIHKRRKRS
jgi:hypothetical protein